MKKCIIGAVCCTVGAIALTVAAEYKAVTPVVVRVALATAYMALVCLYIVILYDYIAKKDGVRSPVSIGQTVYALIPASEESDAVIEAYVVCGVAMILGEWYVYSADSNRDPNKVGSDFCLLTWRDAEERLKECSRE